MSNFDYIIVIIILCEINILFILLLKYEIFKILLLNNTINEQEMLRWVKIHR